MSKYTWHEPEDPPDNDRLILLSFANYPVPSLGLYMGDEENGGNYYTEFSDKSLMEQGIIVNGWMELPKCRED